MPNAIPTLKTAPTTPTSTTAFSSSKTPTETGARTINCGIWRYHPGRKVFEVVCHGTTNPWGMDWDDHGQLFFIKLPPGEDLAKRTASELVTLQLHRNEWFVRQARRLLQERAARGEDLTEARRELRDLFQQQPEVSRKLRALWSLDVAGGINEYQLLELLQHENEHIRLWAVQLLVDDGRPASPVIAAFEARAKTETSGLVLTFLASALQRNAASRPDRLLDVPPKSTKELPFSSSRDTS